MIVSSNRKIPEPNSSSDQGSKEQVEIKSSTSIQSVKPSQEDFDLFWSPDDYFFFKDETIEDLRDKFVGNTDDQLVYDDVYLSRQINAIRRADSIQLIINNRTLKV